MSGLPTGHVGDLGAALVDEQLEPAMRELVLRHMIGCSTCRDEVEQQRQLKARLSALSEPGLPIGLFGRLSALNAPTSSGTDGEDQAELAGGRSNLAVLPAVRPADELPEPSVLPLPDARPFGRSAFLGDAHRGRRLLAGAASLLLVGVGTAYAAASDGQLGSPTQPTANVFTTTDASEASSSVPLNDPAFTAMTASFGH